MKKTYAAPAVIQSGDVVRETKGGGPPPGDGLGHGEAVGSVGFYL
jgi:hypothetical protein